MGAEAKARDLLSRRRPGYSLEQVFYADADLYQLDLERIFYRDWLYAMPACSLPKPGSYVTHRIGAYRLMVVRGLDGVRGGCGNLNSRDKWIFRATAA